MGFRNNFLHYAIYRKILVSIILTVALATAIICIILFSLFSVSTAREIGKVSMSRLSQTSYACDIVYEQVFNVSNQVVVNNEIFNAMFAREKSCILEYHALLNLTYLKSAYSFIKHIGIYNGVTTRYLSTNRASPAKDSEIMRRIAAKERRRYSEFFPRRVTQDENPDEPISVLTFVLYPYYSLSSMQKSAIVVDVAQDYIQHTIQGIGNDPDEVVLVMDSQGIILSHINPDLFLEDLSEEPYVGRILHSDDSAGYFIQTVNGKKQLVTYVKSRSLNWFFVSLKTHDKSLSNIYRVRNITVVLAFVFMLLGVLASFLLTQGIYNPLKALMNRISPSKTGDSAILHKYNEFDLISDAFAIATSRAARLETRLHRTLPALKASCLHFLLKQKDGDIADTPGLRVVPETIREIENGIESPFYCVLLLKIDGYRSFMKENDARSRSLIRLAICNTAHELIGRECKNNAIVMESDEVAILLQLEGHVFPERIVLALDEIREVVERDFQVSLSVGIGDIVSLRNEINLSYESAKEYVGFRLFYGHGAIIDYDRISGRYDRIFTFPSTIEKSIEEALRLRGERIIEQQIDKFVESISTMHYYYTLTYSNRLLTSILDCFDRNIEASSKESRELHSMTGRLSQVDTLEEISVVLKDCCSRICDILNEKKSSKNKRLIEKTQEYVQENFRNPALNIDMMADLAQLSPAYFGKLFKNTAGTSFSDYLNTIRLEKAKELLISTNEPIPSISEKVGIPNYTYFFTLFKKNFGTTPASYRSENSLSL